MYSKKQINKNYWTDTEFHNSSPHTKRLYTKVNKNGGLGFVLLFILNALRNFISNSPAFILLVAMGYIISIVLCVSAVIYAMRLKRLYTEYKK